MPLNLSAIVITGGQAASGTPGGHLFNKAKPVLLFSLGGLGPQPDVQVAQLPLVHFSRGPCHQVLAALRLREGNGITDARLAQEYPDEPV